MNGVRFYEGGLSCWAVTPLYQWATGGTHKVYEAVVGFGPQVISTGVSRRYLKDNCKRVSEARAREIHPNLFVLLKDWGW